MDGDVRPGSLVRAEEGGQAKAGGGGAVGDVRELLELDLRRRTPRASCSASD